MDGTAVSSPEFVSSVTPGFPPSLGSGETRRSAERRGGSRTSSDSTRPARRHRWSLSLLREVVREGFYGLYHHRFRAALSMLGISWGIVSVVMLLAYGDGFRAALVAGFHGAFSDGTVVSFPGQTSLQAGGERAGKRVRVTIEDVLAMGELPLVKNISPEFMHEFPVIAGNKQSSHLLRGVAASYGPMRSEKPEPGGRFLDEDDVRLHRRVAFIGSEVQRKLFGAVPSCMR